MKLLGVLHTGKWPGFIYVVDVYLRIFPSMFQEMIGKQPLSILVRCLLQIEGVCRRDRHV
jgi:hypothetical protein